jgi:hypothetical protein
MTEGHLRSRATEAVRELRSTGVNRREGAEGVPDERCTEAHHATRARRSRTFSSPTAARPLRRRSEDATDRRVQSTYSLFSKTSTRTSHRYRLHEEERPPSPMSRGCSRHLDPRSEPSIAAQPLRLRCPARRTELRRHPGPSSTTPRSETLRTPSSSGRRERDVTLVSRRPSVRRLPPNPNRAPSLKPNPSPERPEPMNRGPASPKTRAPSSQPRCPTSPKTH